MAVQDRYPHYQTDQRRFFDELITEDWDTYQSPEWDYTRKFEVQEIFRYVRPERILDVGCGVGFRDQVMANYDFVKAVEAIDYSGRSIEKAQATHPHPKVRRRVADFASFDPGRQYDLVVSFQVFEHLANPDAFIDFCVRCCVRGGCVAICTPNRLRLDNRLASLRRRPLTVGDPMHYREYVASELVELGKKRGLVPIAHLGHGIHPVRLFGHTFLADLSVRRRTSLGRWLPAVASIITVLMKKEAES